MVFEVYRNGNIGIVYNGRVYILTPHQYDYFSRCHNSDPPSGLLHRVNTFAVHGGRRHKNPPMKFTTTPLRAGKVRAYM